MSTSTFSSICKLSLFSVSVALIGTIHASSVKAAVINIDFYNPPTTDLYSGLGAAPDSSTNTFWNGVGLSGATNLLFSNGTTLSTVGVSTLGFNNAFSNVNSLGANLLLGDRLIPNDGDGSQKTVTISGLSANEKYNLYAYTGLYSVNFAVGSVTGTATGGGFTLSQPSWVEGAQYAKLSHIVPDSLGVITLTLQATIGNNPNGFNPNTTVISGLQIERVQTFEPTSSLSLLGLGSLGVMLALKRVTKSSKAAKKE